MEVTQGRRARRAVVVAVVAAASLSVPASAVDQAGSYVRGGGALADDWRGQGRLDTRGHAHTDLVGMWQAVLWADGYLPATAVTCRYDTLTREATRVWQSNHGLVADGVAGAQTLAFAGSRLASEPPWTVYVGERAALPFQRTEAGVYEVYDDGDFVPIRTDAVSLHRCRDRH